MTDTSRVPPLHAAADPSGLLDRLDPDLLHPARLAGPHAWHVWDLTRHPPTGRDLRLVITPGRDTQRHLRRITASLTDQLTGPTWPPTGHLDVTAHPGRIDCRHHGQAAATITIDMATWDRGGLAERGSGHYTRTGWPVLDQHAALADRIHAIDPSRSDREDLADLAHWVHTTLDTSTARRPTVELQHLIVDLRRRAPRTIDRLATILDRATTVRAEPALTALTDTLDRARQATPANDARRSVTRTR